MSPIRYEMKTIDFKRLKNYFQYFKKEEQNFVSINEIDTMTLIMPSGPGRPRAAALDTAAAGGAAAGGGGGGGGKVLNKTFLQFCRF
jgi:hypothetical protein